MADSGIKKIKILKENLPQPTGTDSELFYELRYRLVSEDKNRTSHWSSLEKINIPNTTIEVGWDPNNPVTSSIPNTLTVNKNNHTLQFNWTMPALLISNPNEQQLALQKIQASIKQFDLYVQWRRGSNPGVAGPWSWINTVSGSNYIMTYLDTDPDYMRFRVQKVTKNKEVLNAATYVVTDWHSV